MVESDPQDTANTVAMASSSSSLEPTPRPTTAEDSSLRCCCGRLDCIFLKHNCSVLQIVEKDVHTAAKMGQVRSS
jgi:hypothetical protein